MKESGSDLVEPIRVHIVDDHELVRYALRTLLEDDPGISVVGESADGEQAIRAVCDSDVDIDVVLMDLRMPGMGGVEACRRIKSEKPEIGVLVLTSFDDDDEVFGVLAVGAGGYIMKDTRPELILHAVRTIADGQAVFDSKIAARVIAGKTEDEKAPDAELMERLSDRELEVLRLMAKGMSNKEIGRALWIGETTVKTHVSHILRKLDQSDRTQAVLLAVQAGLVRLTPNDAG
ncbi:MAG: DNA-binding response regulator [Actinobacteria bacterium HGW-Actinobacteria-10]|jgi:DNA-binding NarL/FixJ family response regulator|nr:MAG: DNA-binding response regulator [Actinobacteria bacterium HGW-Actinobacteria-10]